MNIQATTNRNINFQSTIVKTKYMTDLLESSIKNPAGQRRVVYGIKRIIQDGKKDVVSIDYVKNKLVQLIFPGSYKIKINGKSNGWNYHFIGGGVSQQGKFALEEVYMDELGKINLPNIESSEPDILAKIKKQLNDIQDRIFKAIDNRDLKEYEQLKKSHKSLKEKYYKYTQKELIELKNKFFN